MVERRFLLEQTGSTDGLLADPGKVGRHTDPTCQRASRMVSKSDHRTPENPESGSQGELELRGIRPKTNNALDETRGCGTPAGFGGKIGERPSPRVRSATLGSDVERLRRNGRFP